MVEIQEPEGISFFNVKSGETHYAKLEPTIAGYINSSDMGINASRGQDYGWKLGASWVKRVKAFRRDPVQMQILTARNNGQKPTTTNILYYLYGQELAAYQEDLEENENPFEEQYQRDIADKPQTTPSVAAPQALADFQEDDDDITSLIDSEIAGNEEENLDLPPPVLTPEQQKEADDKALAEMEAEEKAAKAKAEKEAKAAETKPATTAKPTQKVQ